MNLKPLKDVLYLPVNSHLCRQKRLFFPKLLLYEAHTCLIRRILELPKTDYLFLLLVEIRSKKIFLYEQV